MPKKFSKDGLVLSLCRKQRYYSVPPLPETDAQPGLTTLGSFEGNCAEYKFGGETELTSKDLGGAIGLFKSERLSSFLDISFEGNLGGGGGMLLGGGGSMFLGGGGGGGSMFLDADGCAETCG